MSGSTLLVIAILVFLIPPLLLRWTRSDTWLPFLDGFALVGVGGIVGFHLLPEAFRAGGLMAGAYFIAGLLLPSLGERFAQKRTSRSAIWIVILGILPHILLEGTAIGAAPDEKLMALSSAIVAHRLPVALFVFSMISNIYSVNRAWWVMLLLVITTIFGFILGDTAALNLDATSFSGLQALVGGTLLHVIFAHELRHLPNGSEVDAELKGECYHTHHDHTHHDHTHHDHTHHDHTHDHAHNHTHEHEHHHTHHHAEMPDWLSVHHSHHSSGHVSHRWATIGAILGMTLVAYFILQPHGHGHVHHDDGIPASANFLSTLTDLSLEAAPILVLAYLLAGLLRSFVTPTQLRWLGRGQAGTQAFKGVTFGLPLPICSCGVLPIYETLVRRGVPATAAIGFLVATPELGLDAILLSIPLLGWDMTLGRLIAAFTVALLVAVIVGRKVKRVQDLDESHTHIVSKPLLLRLKDGIQFGLVELFDHTFPWVLAGLLAAAWLEPMLDHELFHGMPSYLQVPLFALIGIPIYVCASGSTPLAAIAIHQGVSPGAALAFLIAGPATNITTFGIMSTLHGKKIAVFFGCAVALGAVGAGLCIDYFAIEAVLDLHNHAHHEHDLLGWISVCIIGLLFVRSLFRYGPRGAMAQIANPIHH